MKKNTYQSFSKFVLRTSLLPLSFYENLTSEIKISESKYIELVEDPIIKEAIFLGSPPLFEELSRWKNGEINENKKIEKLKSSLLKYVARMSSRCTPFGIFAGCAVGEMKDFTSIQIENYEYNKRHTRLDMNYLVSLSQDLVQSKHIREQLLFFPNSSIYKAGDELRYVEYKYLDSKPYFHMVVAQDSYYLKKVLNRTRSKGAKLRELAEFLSDEDVDYEDALGFVNELIDGQFLVSELEPSVSGPEFLDQIKSVLAKLSGCESLLSILNLVETNIQELDKRIGNSPSEYIKISNYLRQLNTEFSIKYLFQTDMILEAQKNCLNRNKLNSVRKGLSILNRISLPPENNNFDQFKAAFFKRFESQEVPLTTALDVEMGIGYKQDGDTKDLNPLVDDLIIPDDNSVHSIKGIKFSGVHLVFEQKLKTALKNGDVVIQIYDEDFKEFDENWDDLPDTIFSVVEIVNDDGVEKIKMGPTGGSSGAKLLSRFCHGDHNMKEYVKEIVAMENRMNKDKILAEVIHLSESRVGNISLRPLLREFEIPYLANSLLSKHKQIPIDDLRISVKYNGDIGLRSSTLDKEIVPFITNAHSFWYKSLPIYHFLGDLQTQRKRNVLEISLGPLAKEYNFIPRIEYDGVILREASWNFKREDIADLQYCIDSDNDLEVKVNNWVCVNKIPHYALLADGDNELLINFKNLDSVKMLLGTINKNPSFELKEFLHNKDGIVRGEENNEYYSNEIIVSFYNDKKLKNEY